MGVFSTTKKTYVASLAYNMAGDVDGRLKYLRSSVAVYFVAPSQVGQNRSLSEHIQRSLLNGPAQNQMSMFRWAKNHYAEGLPRAQVSLRAEVDTALVEARIVAPPGYDTVVSSAFVDQADSGYWAEKHILEKYPERQATAWTHDYNPQTDKLDITYADASTETIYPGMKTTDQYYLLAQYTFIREPYYAPWVLGTRVFNQPSAPSMSGYVFGSQTPSVATVALNRKVTTTVDDSADGLPAETTITITEISESFDSWSQSWNQNLDIGLVTISGVESFKRQARELLIWRKWKVEQQTVVSTPVVVGTVTTTVTTVTDVLVPQYDHRINTQDYLTYAAKSAARMMIYRLGSGQWPELDALQTRIADNEPEFFPVLPIRLWNKNVDHSSFASRFKTWKKAYKKMTGGKLEKLLETVSDNADLDDVDHCFLVHGVALNTPEKEGRRYIYEFLRKLAVNQVSSVAQFTAWQASLPTYTTLEGQLQAWIGQQGGLGGLFGTPRPVLPVLKMPSFTSIEIKCPSLPQFDHRLSWITIDEEIFAGLGKVGAVKGELWFEAMTGVTIPGTAIQTGGFGTTARDNTVINRFRIVWQDQDDFWRRLTVVGLIHSNEVYEKKSVTITAKEAFDDPEETGFIFPLHEPTLRLLPLTQRTQLAVSNRYLIFNSYEVVKIRWYEKGAFKILVSIVLAVVVALVFPAAGGILGSNLAIGTSLGLTGISALLAGAVTNAIAGMLVTVVVGNAATEILGEELGAILGALITQLAFSYVAAGVAGTSASFIDWSQLMRAENLLKLTSIGADLMAGYVNAETVSMQNDINQLGQKTQDQIEEIEKRRSELLGSGMMVIDPLMLGADEETPTGPAESRETFLKRTLLTGSDIAELSLSMIDMFPSMSTEIPGAIL